MSIDHGLLSPSGRVSKRAAAIAHKRMVSELFPSGFWEDLAHRQAATQQETPRARLLRQAADLRELAERGMKPRAYRKEAERLEREVGIEQL